MSSSTFTPALLTTPTYPGQNELNLVTNPAAATSVTTGWTAVGLSVSRDTTANPLNPVVPSGFSLSSTASSQTFTSDALTVPATLQNRKLKIEFFYQYVSGTSFTVDVLDGNAVHYNLSTDVSGTTTLAQQTGKFVAYFDTNNTSTLQVRISSTGTGVTKITNIIVGPGIQPQGAALDEWQSYTPVLTASTSNPTTTAASGRYRRVGSNVEIQAAFTVTAYGSGVYIFSLPSGLNINYSATASIGSDFAIGTGNGYVVTNAGSTRIEIVPGFNNTAPYIDKIIGYRYNGSALSNTDLTGASSTIFLVATAPISQYAGSGNVQLAQNDTEYSWNNGDITAAGALNTTAFGYGPSGTAVQSINSTTISSISRGIVRFQTPIQVTDALILEFSENRTTWYPLPFYKSTGGHVIQSLQLISGGGYTGAGLRQGSSTEVEVNFGNSGANSTQTAWSNLSGVFWRVRKSSAGAAVGFGIVNSQSAGLFPITNSNLDDGTATRLGLKQYVHGVTYNNGVTLSLTSAQAGFVVNRAVFIPYQMQDGTWRLKWNIRVNITSATLTALTMTLNGVVFNDSWACSGLWGGNALGVRAFVNAGANTLTVESSSVTTSAASHSGDVELTAKPTWAY